MRNAIDDLLTADAERTAAAIDDLAADLVQQFEVTLKRAIAGQREAVGTYFDIWRRLERRVVDAVREAVPDVGVDLESLRLLIEVEGHQCPSAWAEVLALHAPFSPWAERFGRGRGTALTFVAHLRSHLPAGSPLMLPAIEADREVRDDPRAENVRRFLRFAVDELSRDQPPLARIAETFELSQTELGHLFGVRRQAVSQWTETGIPPSRAPKVNAIARLADILERNLRRERIAGVVRQPAAAYGDLSMLEMIENDRHEELVRLVEGAFDWARAA